MRSWMVVIVVGVSAAASVALAHVGESLRWLEEPVDEGTVTVSWPPDKCGYPVRASGSSARTLATHREARGADPAPSEVRLTIAGDASSSVVVQWGTDAESLSSEVRVGDSPNALDRVVHGYSFEYGTTRREHQVHLCGLEPNRTYWYDAGGASARSTIRSFTTAPADASPVVLLVLGEACADPELAAMVAPLALAEGPRAMMLGGHWAAQHEDGPFGRVVRAAPELFGRLPGIWTYGDARGVGQEFFDRLALPDHGERQGIKRWFALPYGPVSLVVVDDNVAADSSASLAQKDFVARTIGQLDRRKSPWVATVHHVPVAQTELEERVLGLRLDSHRIDIDLSMHARPGGEYAFALLTVAASEFTFDARRADGSRVGTFTVTR